MKKDLDRNILEIIDKLSPYRREKLSELLSYLNSNLHVSGVLLGGSLSYKRDCSKSDVDLFCLIKDKDYEKVLGESLAKLHDFDTVIYQGFFPWTQNLYTLFYKYDIDFTIDLCLIEPIVSKKFFWEPDGIVLLDKEGLIEKYRKSQMTRVGYTKQPFLKQNPFSLSIITLKKIEKNLARKHIWNALEQINILRRYIIQIIRMDVIKNNHFLGRPDRDIEDVLPQEINLQLKETVAFYNLADIGNKTLILIDLLQKLFHDLDGGSEKKHAVWFFKQLQNEKKKISTYIYA